MANLVATAANLLTPEVLNRLASALGIDPAAINKAATAGIPGLLAAFTSLIGKPGGAARLADSVALQSGAAAGGARDTIEGGLGGLSSLLGGGTLSTLTQALGRYSGTGEAGAKGVLGMLGPMVLGVLGQQQREKGLDASGLAQLLQSQAGNITRALPSGFARQLSDAGIVPANMGSPSMAGVRVPDGASRSWLMPVLGLVALGVLGWLIFGRHHDQTVATAPPPVIDTTVPGGKGFIVATEEVKDWLGRPIFTRDNQKVGELIDIRRAPDGKVTDIFFDSGTFLGMGAKRYHITAEQIDQMKPDGVVMTLDEAQVKAMPASEMK
jgi:hypothetical protein